MNFCPVCEKEMPVVGLMFGKDAVLSIVDNQEDIDWHRDNGYKEGNIYGCCHLVYHPFSLQLTPTGPNVEGPGELTNVETMNVINSGDFQECRRLYKLKAFK